MEYHRKTQEKPVQNLSFREFSWPFWAVVPIYPYGQRRTLRTEVVPNTIWTFEQVQGILYVVVPIRMTVVKLETGGLLVYAPVAPTPECLGLMQGVFIFKNAIAIFKKNHQFFPSNSL